MIRWLVRFMVVVRKHFCSSSCTFEWPKHASGWVVPQVKTALKELGLDFSVCVDGCSLNVVNSKGESLRKQWRFDSTSESLVTHMAKFVCDGSHSRAIVKVLIQSKRAFTTRK